MSGFSDEQQEAIFLHCSRVKLADGVRWLQAEYDVTISDTRLGVWLEKQRDDADFRELLSSIRRDAERARRLARPAISQRPPAR